MNLSIFRLAIIGFAATFIAFAPTAHAENVTIDTTKLSAEQITKLNEITGKTSEIVDKITSIDTETVKRYTEVGTAIGSGLAATAKQLGIAVTEFAKTDLGMIATAIIVYKVFLGEFLSNVFWGLLGIAWIVGVFRVWNFYFKKIALIKSETVREMIEKRDNIETPVKETTIEYHDVDSGDVAGYRILMFIVLAISLIPGFVFLA